MTPEQRERYNRYIRAGINENDARHAAITGKRPKNPGEEWSHFAIAEAFNDLALPEDVQHRIDAFVDQLSGDYLTCVSCGKPRDTASRYEGLCIDCGEREDSPQDT